MTKRTRFVFVLVLVLCVGDSKEERTRENCTSLTSFEQQKAIQYRLSGFAGHKLDSDSDGEEHACELQMQ